MALLYVVVLPKPTAKSEPKTKISNDRPIHTEQDVRTKDTGRELAGWTGKYSTIGAMRTSDGGSFPASLF